jgi:hypothetical protein
MSVLTAPLGPIAEIFYRRDYWRPELFNGWAIGIEDIIFAFAIGGITAVIYEEVFGKRIATRRTKEHLGWLPVVIVMWTAWLIGGNIIFGLNSVYVTSIGLLLIGISFLAFRKDLIKEAILSGLLVGTLLFVFYLVFLKLFPGVVEDWWMLNNVSGYLVLGIPIEELVWGFCWGFAIGPAYEFICGYRLKKP